MKRKRESEDALWLEVPAEDSNSLAVMNNISLLSDETQKEVTKAILQCFQKSEVSGVGQITPGDLKETACFDCLLGQTNTDYPSSSFSFWPIFSSESLYWCLFIFPHSTLAAKKHCLDPGAVLIATPS